jgi:hypothetical protein
MPAKPEIRISNFEIRNNIEIQIGKRHTSAWMFGSSHGAADWRFEF